MDYLNRKENNNCDTESDLPTREFKMKKLVKKLKNLDIELPKWTRKLLYDHLMEVCEGLKKQRNFKN